MIRKELEGAATHRLSNILTLRFDVHDMMDNLDLWLEPVPHEVCSCGHSGSRPYAHFCAQDENTYYVRTYPPEALRHITSLNQRVRFAVRDIDLPGFARPLEEYLSLPDRRYLEIHAACCKVAHMSGAADYLDKVVRDMEMIGVLAEDGGSADVLAQAISRLVPPV